MNSVQMQRSHDVAPTPEIKGTLFESLTQELPIAFDDRQCAGTVFSGLSITFVDAHQKEAPLHIASDSYQKLLALLETICYQIPSSMRDSTLTISFSKRSSDPTSGAPLQDPAGNE